MDRELRNRLYWLAEELTEEERALLFDEDEEEEPEYIPPRRRGKPSRAEKMERQRLQKLDPIEDRSAPVVKKKGIKGLLFLAALEILGILLILGWWMQWLI